MTAPIRARRVAVLAPMPSELRPVARALSLHRVPLGDDVVLSGTAGDTEIVATTTGMGIASAAQAAERMLSAAPVDHLVVVGIAGGIDPSVEIGDVVVPSVVVDHSTGREYRPSGLGDTVPSGRLLTSDGLLDNDVLAPFAERGVLAVDMETAAIAAVCEQRQCPWSVFRGISDKISDGFVDTGVFGLAHDDGTPNFPAVARYVLRRPWRLPRLARLGREANVAAKAAAAAVADALSGSSAARAG